MAFRTFIAALAISASLTAPAFAQDVAVAKTALAGDYDRIVKELITITEIPAPPFGEQARAAYFAKAFKDMGLADVAIDAEGNVTGIRRGTVAPGGPLVVISAHLDTVFPKGTNVTVRREGNTLNAPGVGDDTVGLTGMLAWIRAMNAAKVPTRHDILFVGTVGEEGPGDLRGVRYLFTKSAYKDRIAGFISVDGPDPSRIVNQAVGSKRYNIAFTGPGGHSYGAFGIVNPMAAMADAVKRLYETDVPASPRTSFAASVVSGGTSVNSIPDRIELQVDMRSPDPKALDRLEKRFLDIVDQAVAAENFARSTNLGEVGAEKTRIGDRPAGGTADTHPLVVTSQRVLAEHGFQTQLQASSTDSNIPMSLGIPAVTIATGGGGGRAHSVDEYVNVERNAFIGGLSSGLALVVAVANLDWTAK
ncbi:peptidase M20/M25/M40 family protein [Blastomonas sp. RAC04]|jgi:acetylornithine deacetylase/succinyl-diaminopimelate desuccinylase-like protein|uniref:M20/M25/M40 family metallo-hydrolase n=1 Tax=Blastomonas sp. RAC04 TaxID=1842535 RepID=UPI00083DF4C8|nr:M20/M25/M40 family metallo-hydrolase [Blastomonas sp. RAC04]AOG01683.1 peptidase M20/M25/M40 family protein [Blastomonas sp. RAC04]